MHRVPVGSGSIYRLRGVRQGVDVAFSYLGRWHFSGASPGLGQHGRIPVDVGTGWPGAMFQQIDQLCELEDFVCFWRRSVEKLVDQLKSLYF